MYKSTYHLEEASMKHVNAYIIVGQNVLDIMFGETVKNIVIGTSLSLTRKNL